jgi:hypothetical protein
MSWGQMDCFVASLLAMTGGDTPSRSRGALRPRFASKFPLPSNQRAQGTPGARCTRGLVSNVHKKHAHEHTGSAEAIRHSLRSGLTLITCSPRRSGLGLSPSPALLDANLTPALRRQDHTFSPYASAPSRLSAHQRPPHPRPALLTLRNAPLSGTGFRKYRSDWVRPQVKNTEKQKYFCQKGAGPAIIRRLAAAS